MGDSGDPGRSPDMREGISRESVERGRHRQGRGRAREALGQRDACPINVLLPGDREFILDADAEPRWNDDDTIRRGHNPTRLASDAIARDLPGLVGPGRIHGRAISRSPTTPACGRRGDGAECRGIRYSTDVRPRACPKSWRSRIPLNLFSQGDEIRLHLEEYDTVRVISMRSGVGGAVDATAPTLLGHSTGEWQGRHVGGHDYGHRLPLVPANRYPSIRVDRSHRALTP